MASEVIGTAVMVMTTVIITAALLNAIFPSILTSAVSIRTTGADAGDRIATSMLFTNYEVVSPSHVRFEVLNDGRNKMAGSMIPISTVYLSAENQPLLWLKYNTSVSETYWTYTLIGADSEWEQGETMVLDVINPTGSFAEGNYRIRLQLAGGAMSEHVFTV